MKLSAGWLLSVAGLKLNPEQLCEQLTELGLEVESCEWVAPPFSHVVIGEVLSTEPHPNADRLKVCQVNIGQAPLTIVCGAPNARAGIKVAVATIGAVLPGEFKIKAAKLRGVDSEGMLCSETELGLPETQAGILELPADAPIGLDVRTYLKLDDLILDINITPNRGDCLSVLGLARELALKNQQPCPQLSFSPIDASIEEQVAVDLRAPSRAPIYCARVLKGVDNTVATPRYMRDYLTRSGIRLISPVVDILNYVMLLLGQPLHGFDLAAIKGALSVRCAQPGETITLLTGESLSLTPEVLVIADQKQALALAGIMGGKAAEATVATRDLVLESAFFTPELIAGKARRYHLSTEAAHRFERGVDPDMVLPALHLATQLIIDLCGGEAGPVIELKQHQYLPVRAKITLSYAHLEKLLGVAISKEEVARILTGIGAKLEEQQVQALSLIPPSWRFDLKIPEDLIEEVARIKGYDHLPVKIPTLLLRANVQCEAEHTLADLKIFLGAQGLQEVLSFSFVDPELQQHFLTYEGVFNLTNPISQDLAQMRISLIPSIIKILQYNERRQQEDMRIFELGKTYVKQAEGPVETLMLAGALMGARIPKNWQEHSALDFYDLKGLMERLFSFSRSTDLTFCSADLPAWLHPGQGVSVHLASENIGYFGALHPKFQALFAFKEPVFIFELKAQCLLRGHIPVAKPVSKYPSIRRDLALVVPNTKSAKSVLASIAQHKGALLKDCFIFDVYQGEHVLQGHKSLAIALILQHQDRTLVDSEVEAFIQELIIKLQAEGMLLRS